MFRAKTPRQRVAAENPHATALGVTHGDPRAAGLDGCRLPACGLHATALGVTHGDPRAASLAPCCSAAYLPGQWLPGQWLSRQWLSRQASPG